MLQFILVFVFCTGALAQAILGVTPVLPSATIELRDPRSLSVAADGTLFIADTGHHRVLAMDATGKLVVESGGFGTEHGQFQWPRKVIADRGTSVWVLDYGNRRIEKFSRTLEYQGTFFIPSDDDSRPRQIEEMAVSPQGDLYVFDRDGGRLLRYDPLFRVQAELGQDRGQEFISALSRMTFVPKLGLVWWERGRPEVRVADPLLTQIRTLRLNYDGSAASMILAASDSCLVFGTSKALRSWCDPALPPDSLFSLTADPGMNLKRLDDIAFANRHAMYVLDGLAGAVYRVSLSER
jgi:hypothetical protein